jgi:GNAT superfamily N-acetyltransferase
VKDVEPPEGLTARPLALADAAAVAEVTAAEEVHEVGEGDTTEEDIVAEWQRPSYDLASSTLGLFAGDRLVAYADLVRPDFGYTGVHPDDHGRGLRDTLFGWLETTARARGGALISTQVPGGGDADRRLEARGYRVRWTAWDLELPAGTGIVAQPLPEGHALRDARPDEHELVWTVVEDAFSEWRDRQPLADFGAMVWGRPGHEPWNLRLCTDAAGEAVGATHVYLSGDAGYVARIAVRRDRRGHGLARAMLADAFALARSHGAVRCYLSTDSRTGALGLYEKVGMVVTSTWVNRALDL